MFVKKEDWEKLVDSFKDLYRNYDKFGDNARDIIDNIDICINNIMDNKSDKIYVITNNAVVDDEIDYSVYGVATNESIAKEMFKQAVKDAKCDSDFDNINAINVTNGTEYSDAEWYYTETEDSFELYLNGEYNSNNFSIRILEYNIEPKKELESEIY